MNKNKLEEELEENIKKLPEDIGAGVREALKDGYGVARDHTYHGPLDELLSIAICPGELLSLWELKGGEEVKKILQNAVTMQEIVSILDELENPERY